MSLLVVPCARAEATSLTLHEWDLLLACEVVLFEEDDHPLSARLRDAGVDARRIDDEPDAGRTGAALVANPSSPRIPDLARAGAAVTAGAAPVPDPLTAAHAAPALRAATASLGSLTAVMARLRSPDGCPWDREQDHASLAVHLIEETYEVLDCIDRGELGEDLEDELGDLLLQVVFHAQMACDARRFDLAGVAGRIVAKLIRRHPHVFGSIEVSGADEVVANWETIKAEERRDRGQRDADDAGEADIADGLPRNLPALLYAYKIQKRAARGGFAADEAAGRENLRRLLDGDDVDVGELLLWVVALARARGVEPETALRRAAADFARARSA